MPRLLTLLSTALLLGSLRCGGTPAPPPVTGGVVVLGSSTAAGTGATSGHSWAALVQQAAQRDCPALPFTNLAVSGYTTTQALPTGTSTGDRPYPDPAHNLTAALSLKPALVLVQFPSNDAANRYPLAETLANHTTLRDGVRGAGAAEVILGPFPRAFTDPAQVALMTGLRDALPSVGAPRYLPLWSELAQSDAQVLPALAYGDGIHLNDAGHALIAQRVLATEAWKAFCTAK